MTRVKKSEVMEALNYFKIGTELTDRLQQNQREKKSRGFTGKSLGT